ncbi:type VII secretion integral membrane protein EccD [uncultured Streptomyces sp.]|uniref:type VII secretion integral membrane protein EccD n=1 Tax=uncultured Streptomyces sp. TaxID=174707 RepID=UPI00260939DB|nr:type VII secretion integral membrane protein EccD [uncultured Streptomyces sp.]
MSDNQVAGLCRLTVNAPARTIDLAVPSDGPVADLLPAILDYAGEELRETGIEHGGWVLQRLGGEPLDEERTLASFDVRDGETLYLRPRTRALPEVRLDDLVDGIATTMSGRPYGWSPQAGRRTLLGLAVAVLVTALLALALPGGSLSGRAAAAAAVGLLLLAGAGAASRAVGDAGAGAALGALVGPYLALAGWLLTAGEPAGPYGQDAWGPGLLAASAAWTGGSVLALAAVAAFAALYLFLAVLSVFGALAALLVLAAGVTPAGAAAVVALAAVVLGAFVPSLSFRMSGMRMPPLPTNASQLQEGIEPHSTSAVAARAVVADGWMTALYGAVGLVCGGALTVLVLHDDWPETLMVLALVLLLVLHARGLGHVGQRLSLTAPAAWGGLLLAFAAVRETSPEARLPGVAGLLGAAAVLSVLSWSVPGRRLVPYWGRAGEILHSAAAISLLPLALWVLGVYGALRAL